jgi:hypothetical protein
MRIHPLIAARENARRQIEAPALVLHCETVRDLRQPSATMASNRGSFVLDFVSGEFEDD